MPHTDRPTYRLRAGPSGVHCFDRSTGLNCLFDEVRVPLDRWAVAPRQVSVALTNACAHCYAPKAPASLSLDRLRPWLAELDAIGRFAIPGR